MRDPVIRVLVVEDDEEDYLLTGKLLRDSDGAGFDVQWARTYDAALEELRTPHDVCLVDYRLGPHSGLSLIERAIADGFVGPMILLTGRGDHDVDVQAMKAGAADYLVKDQITPQLMERVIRHAIERKASEVALRRSEEQLRESQKMEAIGSLAAGMAHDFNNLLSVILGYSELLAADLQASDPVREALEEIKSAGSRAADLTRQLLAFSRGLVLPPSIVALADVLSAIEKRLRRVIPEDVTLTLLVPRTLGAIKADPGQMEQVIMNLAMNACEAMLRGGALTIELTDVVLSETYTSQHVGMKPGPHVALSVTDTGVGMGKEIQARVFEPFFTTKGIGKGSGLGLASVFGIVRQSGGTISLYSQPQKGTTFTIHFPTVDEAAIARAPLVPLHPTALRGSETILLVEDEERVRLVARTILRKYGYDVLEAAGGDEAIRLCEQHKGTIHLLLTDVVMPKMSGWKLAARLLASRPGMRVLYMSGYVDDTLVRNGILDSTITFIQKPITPESLVRKVREALIPVVHPDVLDAA